MDTWTPAELFQQAMEMQDKSFTGEAIWAKVHSKRAEELARRTVEAAVEKEKGKALVQAYPSVAAEKEKGKVVVVAYPCAAAAGRAPGRVLKSQLSLLREDIDSRGGGCQEALLRGKKEEERDLRCSINAEGGLPVCAGGQLVKEGPLLLYPGEYIFLNLPLFHFDADSYMNELELEERLAIGYQGRVWEQMKRRAEVEELDQESKKILKKFRVAHEQALATVKSDLQRSESYAVLLKRKRMRWSTCPRRRLRTNGVHSRKCLKLERESSMASRSKSKN